MGLITLLLQGLRYLKTRTMGIEEDHQLSFICHFVQNEEKSSFDLTQMSGLFLLLSVEPKGSCFHLKKLQSEMVFLNRHKSLHKRGLLEKKDFLLRKARFYHLDSYYVK